MSSPHGNQLVSDRELIETFDEIKGPFVTASELENRLPITRTAIHKRLQKLHREGKIDRKKPTQHMIGWWQKEN
ncbi:HTH domain-containing protein [Halomicroarcula sp. F27]|uniref:HTH domain-containing protein n=1 Tax=Haloarcula nitratireducens TaxID=2487749 RepID=A0AAW4PGL5_9EURY|nr:HTH domain-containing protein [Halomicroarcula nitratireducens]